MRMTTEARSATVRAEARDERPNDGGDGVRLAGVAGMAFAISVLAQNAWSQAAGVLPAPDASSAEVVEAFRDAGANVGVLVGWVAANLVLLAVFLAGAHSRLRQRDPVSAGMGLVAGIGLTIVFASLQIPLVGLAVGVSDLADSPDLVSFLWTSHNALFAFAGVFLSIALFGFARAAGAAGLIPRWLAAIAPFAALIMLVTSIPVQMQAEGEPALMVGLVGFLAWMAFLLVFGNRLRQQS